MFASPSLSDPHGSQAEAAARQPPSWLGLRKNGGQRGGSLGVIVLVEAHASGALPITREKLGGRGAVLAKNESHQSQIRG